MTGYPSNKIDYIGPNKGRLYQKKCIIGHPPQLAVVRLLNFTNIISQTPAATRPLGRVIDHLSIYSERVRIIGYLLNGVTPLLWEFYV